MKTYLTYTHGRDIFKDFEFRPFIRKYFKDVKFEGSEYGNWYPKISISNWDEVKDILPKSYKPIKIENVSS